ncbi:MAG: cytochrome b N-terminal domain-containing protein [Verrucomicrobia bacterium]|nr:cytochrome b N-terminal domain-containing protein [Verrucomicrobiota bacterium]
MSPIEQTSAPIPNKTSVQSRDVEKSLEEQPLVKVRAERFIRLLENGSLYTDRFIQRFLPSDLNPFSQLGAIANTCLIIALISGVALLVWYSPSVHQAHASMEAIKNSSWIGQWVRSLHRYSSDACMFMVLLHAGRLFLQRRFTGSRWLAWTTGILLLALLWFLGWTGYWLVWDTRAQHVATGSARFIDSLPLFVEPLSRSFLTNDSVHSLLFFLVFFSHMLLPLVMGIALWMHLMRVNRARLLTGRAMTYWIVGSLVVISTLLPATSSSQAEMTAKATEFTMDWWYLWPIVLTDRLNGGMLWGIFLFGSLVTLTLPWWMVKRRMKPEQKAQVETSRCIGCTHCASDCPFNAITMVARDDGKPFPSLSFVNPDLCVGCGICVGACDSQAINLPWLNSRDERREIDAWVDAQVLNGQKPFLAFICRESAKGPGLFQLKSETLELPGYRVRTVPCAGWVSAVLIERALERGVEGILIIGCSEGDPVSREGGKWLKMRLEGTREPKLDLRKADPARIRFIKYDRTRRAEMIEEAEAFRQQRQRGPNAKVPKKIQAIAFAVALTCVLSGIMFALSDFSYRTSNASEPQLVVSFNHRGDVMQERTLTQEERDKLLPHMRAQVSISREKTPVHLRITVNGNIVWDQAYAPGGLSKDGPSVATVRLPVRPGAHAVKVQIADTADATLWTHEWEQEVVFEEKWDRVLLFNTRSGFSLH